MKIFKILYLSLILALLSSFALLKVSANEPAEIVNLSVGKPYTTVRVSDSTYPDTDNKELTDGILGTLNSADPAWSGCKPTAIESGKAYDYWHLYTAVIDLGDIKSITKVTANFLRVYNSYIHMPRMVRVFASEDGINWMQLSYQNMINGDVPNGIYSYGWHHNETNGKATDLTYDENSSVKARYVRFDFKKLGFYHFIDEITVMGYDGIRSDAITPTNTTKLEEGEILRAGEKTGFVQDMVLISCDENVTRDYYKPFISYVDVNNHSSDTLFDTVTLCPRGHKYTTENEEVTSKDWHNFIEELFLIDKSYVSELNNAAKQLSIDLNNPEYKAKLIISIPYPSSIAQNFGEIDGKVLDLSKEYDAESLVIWYCDKILSYIENGNYQYIDFVGFYWSNEFPNRIPLINFTTDYIHELGYKIFWIPYFDSHSYLENENLGFDALTLQPNHFFDEKETGLGGGGTKIINTVARLGAYSNFGVEMEFDGRVNDNIGFYNRGLDYFNAAVESGFTGPGYFRNWYEGGGAIPYLASSKKPYQRQFYDNIYEVIKGTYQKRDYITELSPNVLLNKPYTHNVTNWYSDRCNDSTSTFLTDGETNGTYYESDYFGASCSSATVEFDLSSSPLSLRELHLIFLQMPSDGVFLPDSLDIYYKEETSDSYKLLYSGGVTSSHFVLSSDKDINVKALKFDLKARGTLIFIKEILAYEENNNVKTDVSLPCYNVLSKKSYETNVTNWYTSFGDAVDTDSTRLTDGKYVTSFYNGSYFGALNTSPTIIDFNLKENIILRELAMMFIVDQDAGVPLPSSVKVEGIVKNSSQFVTLFDGEITDSEFVLLSENAIEVSDLKLTITHKNQFLFISEIEAYNNVSGNSPDATFSYKETVVGDVTGDGKLSRADLLRFAKYFGGTEVYIDTDASDINGDGKLSRADLLRLAKIFGGFYTK